MPMKHISLISMAINVLQADTAEEKCIHAHELKSAWEAGRVILSAGDSTPLPTRPGRPAGLELVAPKYVKRRRLGSEAGRIALLHAIAHIEFNAIDLAADMLARFGASPRIADDVRNQFIYDWVGVCDDEARHFKMISDRLQEMGSFYGALLAHNGLWEAASDTTHDLAARLAVAPMILEARGLDVTPGMIEKLKSVGDINSADILIIIYNEEIAHVAAGVRWFSHICAREQKSVEDEFKTLLKTYYKGTLKPPFNSEARAKAGFSVSLYTP